LSIYKFREPQSFCRFRFAIAYLENRNLFVGFGLPKLWFINHKDKKLPIEKFIFQ